MKSPTAELQKQVEEGTKKLMQDASEVTKLQAELQKKYPTN